MPKIRRKHVPPAAIEHLAKRVRERGLRFNVIFYDPYLPDGVPCRLRQSLDPVAWALLEVHHRNDPHVVGQIQKHNRIREL